MSRILGQSVYSIAAVSKLAGVSCHTLRVWERRYGFPAPLRSASGHRRYPQDQVSDLRALAKLSRSGRSIGEVMGNYRSGNLDLHEVSEATVEDHKPPYSSIVDLLFDGKLDSAEETLDSTANHLKPLAMIEQVIEPALIEIGERWFQGECDIYQEHYAVACLYGWLGRLLDRVRRENSKPSRTMLVGTVQGDRHEGGVIMVSLALELAECRAVVLGVDLPVVEFQKAIDHWQPDALVLSFVLSRNINKRFQELGEITDIPIFVGGRSILNHQGLARRHGLIPLTGPFNGLARQFQVEFDLWRRCHGRTAPTPVVSTTRAQKKGGEPC